MATNREKNLELGRRFNDLWNARDPAFWEIPAPGFVIHVGKATPTLEQAKAADRPLLSALPDCRREIVRELADDNFLVHHWRCSGYLASNGRLVEWEGSSVFRVEDGSLAEMWVFGDPADPRLE